MAVLAIGAVGAGIGWASGVSTIFGMSAVSFGWNVGLTVGGMLFGPKQPDQFGPRLGDLKVQASTYGNPIPIIYGSMRTAGNVIWSTAIVETAHTTSSGGGGKGGGGGVTQTGYTYSQSFAVGICAHEIIGIKKIYANGKLIYNVSDTADAATIVASNAGAAGIRIHTGSETQTADSLIQASVGAADCPAYRGLAYVVFDNLQLANYGNRMPNLEFEVVRGGGYAHLAGGRTDYPLHGYSYSKGAAFDSITNSIWIADEYANTVSKVDINTGTKVDYTFGDHPHGVAFDPVTNSVWVANSYLGTVSKINIHSGARVDLPSVTYPEGIAFDPVTNSVWVTNNATSGTVGKTNIHTGSFVEYAVGNSPAGIAFDPVTNSVWVVNQVSNSVSKINVLTGARADYPVGVYPLGVAFDSVTSSVWVTNSGTSFGTVSKVNILTGERVDYAVGLHPVGIAFDPVTNSVWVCNEISYTLSKINIFDGSRIDYGVPLSCNSIAFDPVTNSVWVAKDAISKFNIQDYGITSVAPSLSSIVSDICIRAGLTAGQLDVTALTDTVHGYMVQRGTARSQLEQLMSAFYFDAVESDGKIKFVKRGGAPVVLITEDDLAAHDYGGAPPDTLMINRKQEMELPIEMHIQYLDANAAYQIGSQYSQRLTTNSENKTSLNLAVAMTATKAKQTADVLMYDAWTTRTSFNFQTSWKYSYLEPTDIIQITKGGHTYNARIVDEDYALVSNRTAVLDDATIYTQTAPAAPLPPPPETVSTVPLVDMLMLDIPLLRDQDDGVGFYAAACGYTAGWRGAQAFKSNDGGATWGIFGNALLNEATIGLATTVLGDFTQNIFDESNSVTVVLITIGGTLASDTELNVLNGANAALLGNELIQFKSATLIAANTYKLTGLLRGRKGTEWARANHAVNDRFVLLDSATTYIFTGTGGEYDASRKYRGVSFGRFISDATTIDFANTAVAQECYSPVQLGGGRNAALDVVLNWVRRTRLGGDWNNYVDVPLGETVEAYEVEIWDAGYNILKRTITGLASPTTTYTAAQQATDFGGAQATVYWKVFQLSATRGRGYEAKGVI